MRESLRTAKKFDASTAVSRRTDAGEKFPAWAAIPARTEFSSACRNSARRFGVSNGQEQNRPCQT